MVDDFEKMVRANQKKNCTITSKNITNANVKFGTHLAGGREKTIIRTPKRVDSDCVAIPREFQLLHKSFTLISECIICEWDTFFDYAIQEASFCDWRKHVIQDW